MSSKFVIDQDSAAATWCRVAGMLGLMALLVAWTPLRAGTDVQGQVTGQDEAGEYLGPIEGAVIELTPRGGTIARKATTDDAGSYLFERLAVGEYTYTIKAEGFATEEAGRGFVVPDTTEGLVLDFILTRGEAEDEKAAELTGRVRRGTDEEAIPVSGAKISARQVSGGPVAFAESGADGGYRLTLPTGEWRVSAQVGAAPAIVHDEVVRLEAEGRATVDFLLEAVPRVAADETGDEPLIGVQGTVTSQDEEGGHLGILAGAKVEFLNAGGEVAGSADTDEFGFYQIESIGRGRFTYRLTAEGHRTDDSGRGVELTRLAGVEVLDFILTQGAGEDQELGKITGKVSEVRDGENEAVADAEVFVICESGARCRTATDEEGSYSIEVEAGSWRVSATLEGYPPKVSREPLEIEAGGEVRADFVFKSGGEPAPDQTGALRALVSVERGAPGAPNPAVPEVVFVNERSGERILSKVEPLPEDQKDWQGIASGGFLEGRLEWFVASPAHPLPPGSYFAEAEHADCLAARSTTRTSVADQDIWLDVMLLRLPAEGDEPVVELLPLPPGKAQVEGTVTGQTDQGEHEGPVAGARVDLFENGRRAASARTDELGHYRIEDLAPGHYTYRVSGPPYATEDSGRGFALPKDGESYVLDLILCRGVEVPAEPARLAGTVIFECEEGDEPLADATVMVVSDGNGTPISTTTDAEGMYEFVLPAGNWRVAATVEGLGNHVHPGVIALPAGGEEGVNFAFSEPEPEKPEVFVLIAVERLPDEEGEDPEVGLVCPSDEREFDGLELEPLGSDPSNSEFFREFGLKPEIEGDWQWYVASPGEEVEMAPGLYQATGSLDGYMDARSAIKTAGADAPVILDLVFRRVKPRVLALVESADRTPLEGVRVRFINKTLGQSYVDATKSETEKDGKARVILEDGLGDYHVTFNLDGYAPQTRPLVADREKIRMRVQLFREGETPTVDLAGTVVEMEKGAIEGGDGVASATLTFEAAAGQDLPAGLSEPLRTDGEGGFSVPKLEVGTYAYRLEAEGFKSRKGELTVELGMEPVVLPLEPVNRRFEDAIRRLLTAGWGPGGKTNATRYYEVAVKEEPGDCRADYAKALAELSTDSNAAGEVSGAVAAEVAVANASKFLTRAIKKTDRGMFWDRACEAGVWAQLWLDQKAAGCARIQFLCEKEYANREPGEASKETCHLFGVAMGFLMGPASTPATAAGYLDIDSACMKALQEPHLSEYKKGKLRVPEMLGEMSAEQEKERRELAEGEVAEQAEMADEALARIREIDAELDRIEGQAKAGRDRFELRWRGRNPDAGMGNIQRLEARIAQLQLLRSRPTRGCVECGAYNAGCQSCMAAHHQACAGIDAELRQLQFQLQNERARALQDRQEYDREWRELDLFLRKLEADARPLERERQGLTGKANSAPDIKGMMDDLDRDFEEARKDFSFYWDIDHEARKTELLESLGR